MGSAVVQSTGLVAREVEVRIGDKVLVQSTDLDVKAGELCAVIGVSGSGKSTLLRTLAGVDIPDNGFVTVDGKPVAQRTDLVGYVPFGDLVHRQLTVREALSFAAALRVPDADHAERDARVTAVIEELRMEDRAESVVGSLSDGERRRVGCGTELVGQPKLLVLDEPTTGLDPDLQRRFMRFLRGLADHGLAVMISTHATGSLELCDRIVVMGPGGKIRFVGSREEVLVHFGIDTIDDVYDVVARTPEGESPRLPSVPKPADAEYPPMPSLGQQLSTLTTRYATCFWRQSRTLAILIGQAPVIGLAIGVALPRSALDNVDLTPFYSLLICFILAISATWLGLTASSREIAAEGPILHREAAIGVRIDAYLLSKCAVIGPIVAVQILLLIAPLMLLHPIDGSISPYIESLPVFMAAGFAGAAIGLLISATVRNTFQATAAVPLIIIPQLLFAGALIPHSKMPAPIQLVSDLTIARWTLAGAGSSFDIERRAQGDVSTITGLDPSFFGLNPVIAVVVCLGIITVSFIACVAVLGHRLADATPGRVVHD